MQPRARLLRSDRPAAIVHVCVHAGNAAPRLNKQVQCQPIATSTGGAQDLARGLAIAQWAAAPAAVRAWLPLSSTSTQFLTESRSCIVYVLGWLMKWGQGGAQVRARGGAFASEERFSHSFEPARRGVPSTVQVRHPRLQKRSLDSLRGVNRTCANMCRREGGGKRV